MYSGLLGANVLLYYCIQIMLLYCIILYPRPQISMVTDPDIGGIFCNCECIPGDLESGVLFFWCRNNNNRPNSSHHIDKRAENRK